jgi:hypothetical protein
MPRLFQKRVLRKIFGPKREEVTWGWRKPLNEKLHYLYASLNTVEPGYNDSGLNDITPITSDIMWYQLIPHC